MGSGTQTARLTRADTSLVGKTIGQTRSNANSRWRAAAQSLWRVSCDNLAATALGHYCLGVSGVLNNGASQCCPEGDPPLHQSPSCLQECVYTALQEWSCLRAGLEIGPAAADASVETSAQTEAQSLCVLYTAILGACGPPPRVSVPKTTDWGCGVDRLMAGPVGWKCSNLASNDIWGDNIAVVGYSSACSARSGTGRSLSAPREAT